MKATILVTDGRFTVQARAETSGVRLVPQKGSLFEFVGTFLKSSPFRRLGFDPSQVTVRQLEVMRKAAGGRVRWVAAVGIAERLRMRKDAARSEEHRVGKECRCRGAEA